MSTYRKQEILAQSDRTLVFRVLELKTQKTYIVKSLAQEHPTGSELARLSHEVEILSRLSHLEGVPSLVEKTLFQGRHSIVLSDSNAIALTQRDPTALEIGSFFNVAISTVEALSRIHGKGIIHKDINPGNIVSLRDFSKTWIIDYSIAARIQREVQALTPLKQLEGTLHYLAPEQSGRINRSLDYRADYYSLGITLFELLAGKKPFDGNDIMELFRAHMVQPLPDLGRVRTDIPLSLVQIVEKLAAKDPDDRYQSSSGLLADLKRSKEAWSRGELTAKLILGQDDLSEQFMVPEKIYGRDQEVKALMKIFEEGQLPKGMPRSVQKRSEHVGLTLIAGSSGVGKSALIHELLKPVSERGGYLVEGKVDQFQRSVLLFGFKAGLLSLFDLLTGESRDLLGQVRDELAQKLGPDVGVITDLLPELAVYLGEYPKPPGLEPKSAQARFLTAFAELFETLAMRKPLVFFIDDLQWADLTTLDLIQHLAERNFPGLMLIGSYRSNEVNEGHPVKALIQHLGSMGVTFDLQPLMESAVKELLADALGQTASLDEVTKLLIQRTGGNPFFVHQLLKKLYAEEILDRDPVKKAWKVDLGKLEHLQVSQNVVEFLLGRLRNLAPTVQAVLNAGAAYGARFELHPVALLLQKDPHDLISAFQTAVEHEIIRPTRGNYQHLMSNKQYDDGALIEFQFLHDRLQQASYELKSEAQCRELHFDIGNILVARKADVIAIAEQFLKADWANKTPSARRIAAGSFLSAAIKAKDSSGFELACLYVEKARSLCEDKLWESEPEFFRKLHLEAAQILFFAARFEDCAKLCAVLLERSTTDIQRAEAYQLMFEQATYRGDLVKGLQLGLKGLQYLGIQIKEKTSFFTVVKNVIKTEGMLKKIQSQGRGLLPVLDFPVTQDPKAVMTERFLLLMGPTAYMGGNMNVCGLLLLLGVQHCFQYGLTESSVFTMAGLPVIFNPMGKYKLTQDVYEVTIRLISHPASTNKKMVAGGLFMISGFNSYLHVKNSEYVSQLKRGFEIGYIEKNYVNFNNAAYIVDAVAPTIPLSQLSEYQHYLKRMNAAGDLLSPVSYNALMAFFQSLNAKDLEEQSESRGRVKAALARAIEFKDSGKVGIASLPLLMDLYLFGNVLLSKAQGTNYYKNVVGISGFLIEPKIEIVYALILLKWSRESKARLNLKEKFQLNKIRTKLKKLALHNPANFSHYHHLVEAEFAFNQRGSEKTVSFHYRAAIQFAKEDGNLFIEALASERAGEYYLAQGNPEVARFYLQKAHAVYAAWEAWALVRSLGEKHADLLAQTGQEGVIGNTLARSAVQAESQFGLRKLGAITSEGTASGGLNLDFEEVLKAARSLSSEVLLPRLTEKLMKIVSEVSGAEKGALLLPQKDGRFAVYSQFDKVGVSSDGPITEVPTGLVDRVRTKKEPLIFADASKEDRMDQDPYFRGRTIHSVVCLPTLNQGNLLAVLYLENNAVTGAFTVERLKTLDILASQAAVSIENARLYETLEEKVRERTAQLASKTRDIHAMLSNLQQGVFTILKDGTIHPEYSTHLEVLLGEKDLAGKNPLPLLFNHSSVGSNSRDQIRVALGASLEGSLVSFELNCHLLPTQLTRKLTSSPLGGPLVVPLILKDQFLELEWKPILDAEEEVEKLLVTVRDVTDVKRLQLEAHEQKVELEMIGELLECGLEVFYQAHQQALSYFGENRALLKELKAGAAVPPKILNQLFRNIHTIKGNARTLRLIHAVDALHEAEQTLADLKKNPTQSVDPDRLNSDLKSAQFALERYFNLAQDKLGALKSRQDRALNAILDSLKTGSTSNLSQDGKAKLLDQVFDQLTFLNYQPLDEILQVELRSLPELARSLGKEPPELEIHDKVSGGAQYLLSVDHAPVLKDVFTHALRNAIDHGLEPAAERRAKGKSEAGRLCLTVRRPPDSIACFDLVLSDDGKGLNLEAIRRKGVTIGSCSESSSDAEIAELIFESGLSTASSVTEVSGRGVGMDAVRALVEKAGGRVRLEFTGERTLDGYRPFQLVFTVPQAWISASAAVRAESRFARAS